MTNFGRNFVFLWKINCLALFNVFIFLFFYKCPVGTSAYQKLLLLNKCPRALNRSKIRSILKNCVELLIKHSCRGLFLIKLYGPLPETLLETDCLPVSLKKPSRAVFFFFFFAGLNMTPSVGIQNEKLEKAIHIRRWSFL